MKKFSNSLKNFLYANIIYNVNKDFIIKKENKEEDFIFFINIKKMSFVIDSGIESSPGLQPV